MQFPKKIIDNPVNMGLLLEFKATFPDEIPLTVEEYLKGGSRDIILNVAAFFLGFKNHNSKFNDNRELLRTIFGTNNKEFANQVYQRVQGLEADGNKVVIINPYSSLTLFELYFKEKPGQETQTKDEFEVNLFKAYLVLNSQYTTRQQKAFESTQNLDIDLAFPMLMFCMNYPVFDIQHYDINEIWLTQLLKAILLFQFLEEDKKTVPLYNAFLKHFGVTDWQEYLKSFLPLTISMMTNDKESHTDFTVTSGENYEKACSFIEKLIVRNDTELNENDFLSLRANPIYQISDGVYRLVFNLFVVEKIFKGLYFLLRDVNETLPPEQKVKEIKSFYGDFFSERVLLYKIIEAIFPDKYIRFSGQELVKEKISDGPDYYIRKYNDILLIESKDFLIPADARDGLATKKWTKS